MLSSDLLGLYFHFLNLGHGKKVPLLSLGEPMALQGEICSLPIHLLAAQLKTNLVAFPGEGFLISRSSGGS